MPRALVVGGAGFIGSHLCKRLLEAGYSVVCLDDLSTGRRQNVANLLAFEDFRFIEADVVEPLPSLPQVDYVYHLGSPASPPGYRERPIATLRVNSEGTRQLLELAHRDAATFLYASTSEIYGDPLVHPQSEDYRGNVSSTGPRSMYDEGKRYGEALTTAFAGSLGVDTRIVRLFNTYGPNSDAADGRIVPNFVTQALRNHPITIYGDGQQTRSLCYVSDTVEGIVRAAETPGLRGEVVNIGNPQEHTVLEYASLIRDLVGSTSSIEFVQQPVGDDPARRRPDVTRARALLGWEPLVDLADGLSLTAEYFRSELGSLPTAAIGARE